MQEKTALDTIEALLIKAFKAQGVLTYALKIKWVNLAV
jgi:hypothetical protein